MGNGISRRSQRLASTQQLLTFMNASLVSAVRGRLAM